MSRDQYLLDNNTLIRLRAEGRHSIMRRRDCHIIEEVAHEARYLDDVGELEQMRLSVTTTTLRILQRVMASLGPDNSLVDLYRNKGNADPLLIASALEKVEASETTLLPERWLIVTEDHGLREAATALGVRTLSLAEFISATT